MAQTTVDRKTKRLEAEVKKLKEERDDLKRQLQDLHVRIGYEREWRMDFQRLVKAAAHEDNLESYERRYYW